MHKYRVIQYKLFCNFLFTYKNFWSMLMSMKFPPVYYILVVIPASTYINII